MLGNVTEKPSFLYSKNIGRLLGGWTERFTLKILYIEERIKNNFCSKKFFLMHKKAEQKAKFCLYQANIGIIFDFNSSVEVFNDSSNLTSCWSDLMRSFNRVSIVQKLYILCKFVEFNRFELTINMKKFNKRPIVFMYKN